MKAKLGNRIESNYCKQPRKVLNRMQSVLCLCWSVLEDTLKKDGALSVGGPARPWRPWIFYMTRFNLEESLTFSKFSMNIYSIERVLCL